MKLKNESMNTWTPLWSQVVESTLWEEPLPVRVLFLTMLAIKDPDHVVRMPFRRLCKKANMEPEVCQPALKVLMDPDSRSAEEQAYQGRRVEEVEGGWLVLNGEHYRKEMSKLMLRLRKTEWQREDRAKKRAMRGKALPGEARYVEAAKAGASEEQLGAIAAEGLPVPEVLQQRETEEVSLERRGEEM